jgi:hypothetical protein
VLNWERLSNNKPCSASAYQLNSLVIAGGVDQAAIAPEGGPKYRLVGPGGDLTGKMFAIAAASNGSTRKQR